MFQFSRRFAFY